MVLCAWTVLLWCCGHRQCCGWSARWPLPPPVRVVVLALTVGAACSGCSPWPCAAVLCCVHTHRQCSYSAESRRHGHGCLGSLCLALAPLFIAVFPCAGLSAHTRTCTDTPTTCVRIRARTCTHTHTHTAAGRARRAGCARAP